MRLLRVVLLLVTTGVTAAVVQACKPAPVVGQPFRAATPVGQANNSVRVIMLGTGSPIPDPKAFGPATAIAVGSRIFLVDAGAGVTRQLAAAGFQRIKEVEATFLTHLHSDHTLGYPDLVLTTWIMGRRSPLVVYGPPGLKRMTASLLDAWRDDIDLRVTGLEREKREWLAVDPREIDAGTIYDKDGVRVTAFRVRHAEWKNAFGFRFDAPGRSITISGDAAPSETLVAAARGTDVLIHEVYIESRLKPENRPGGERWPEYMRAAHTSNVELGRLASRIQPGLLVLHHVLRMGGTDEELLEGIRAGGYAGRVVIAKDLDVF
jgi:ribonuclease BN (tRNA processing enzyme)